MAFISWNYLTCSFTGCSLLLVSFFMLFLAGCAWIQLFFSGRLLSEGVHPVLNVGTRKALGLLGVLLPLPPIAFCLLFIFCAVTHDDYLRRSQENVHILFDIEYKCFNKSVFHKYVSHEPRGFGAYVFNIQARLMENWKPTIELDRSKRVYVDLYLTRGEGYLRDIKLVRLSGNYLFDRSVLEAVIALEPYGKIEEGPSEVRLCFDYYVSGPLHSLDDIVRHDPEPKGGPEYCGSVISGTPFDLKASVRKREVENQKRAALNEIISAAVSVDFGPILNYYGNNFQKQWSPPEVNKSMRVVAGFTVLPSGAVRELKILSSSGHSGLDRSCLEAIDNAPPRRLPKRIDRDMQLEFVFNYYVLKNGKAVSPFPDPPISDLFTGSVFFVRKL